MHGMRFGEIHSFDDLNLILSKADIPPAAVKTMYVDNPGGDGSWDLTEANGKVNYKDRTAKFTFSVLPEDDFETKKTEVSNLLNGRRFKITLDKDPEYYWDGRCTVDQYSSNKKMRQIVVGASVAPYKMKQEKTNVFVPFCGKNLFDKNNLPLVYGGAGCTLSTLESGVRLYWTEGQWTSYVARFLPIQMLLGKTITLSANLAAVGGVKPCIIIGYVSADGSRRLQKVEIKETGCISLDIGKDAAAYDNIGIWLYANAGADPETVSEGAYADYTNVVIELGNTVADRRNLLDLTSIIGKTVTDNGGTLSCGEDGGITGSGIPTGYVYIYNKGYTLPVGTYTISCSGNAEYIGCTCTIRDKNRTVLATATAEPKTPTQTINLANYPTYYDIVFEIKRTANNVAMSGTAYFQLEKGNVATEYAQYVPFTPYSEDQAEVEITLTNGRKTVSPVIICTDEAKLNVNGAEFSLSEGTHKILDFQLTEGETAVTLTGTGTATIIYQEGDL